MHLKICCLHTFHVRNKKGTLCKTKNTGNEVVKKVCQSAANEITKSKQKSMYSVETDYSGSIGFGPNYLVLGPENGVSDQKL